MGEKKKKEDGGKKVTDDTKALRTAAARFDEISDDLTPYVTPLKIATLATGSFPDATLIKSAIENGLGVAKNTSTQAVNLLSNAEKMSAVLKEISTNLIKIATAYEQAKDDTDGEVNRLDSLIKDINTTLGGDSSVTVTKEPKTPPF